MADGLTGDLLRAAACLWLFGLWLTSRSLPFAASLPIATVKVVLPLCYFAWFFDGTWTYLDDMTYLRQGTALLQQGYTPVTALSYPGVREMIIMAGSPHILYIWWNLLAQALFGVHYYAPVFLNVGLTFVGGWLLQGLLRELGFDRRYQSWCLAFFLLHWDVLAWSSLVNLKDTVMMTLTILSLLLMTRLARQTLEGQFRFRTLAGFAVSVSLFAWIRFYIPLVFLLAGAIWLIAHWRARRKWLPVGLIVAVFGVLFHARLGSLVALHPAHFIGGLVRFPLTPQPWGIDPNYSFLLIPSTLHWLMLGPALVAGVLLWRGSRLARLSLLYLGLIVLFYAAAPELAGPRQRVQITPVLAWLQFHFLWLLAGSPAPEGHRRGTPLAGQTS